jgi:hypothetical protein
MRFESMSASLGPEVYALAESLCAAEVAGKMPALLYFDWRGG